MMMRRRHCCSAPFAATQHDRIRGDFLSNIDSFADVETLIHFDAMQRLGLSGCRPENLQRVNVERFPQTNFLTKCTRAKGPTLPDSRMDITHSRIGHHRYCYPAADPVAI